jgi:uncharacterized protein GlcG (DUF336 family)
MNMNKTRKISYLAAIISGSFFVSTAVNAACSDISYTQLKNAAANVLAAGDTDGLSLNMWVTFVDETGKVCDVATTGTTGALASRSEWLGSRVISAQKANTANAFSLDGLAISTGALYAAVQPGGSLYGLQESNPVDAEAAYSGNPNRYGTNNDPMRGKRVGGVNVFGGGLPVYKGGVKVGAIGVSGDTSCTDHAFAWRVRDALGLKGNPTTQVEAITLTDVTTADAQNNGLGKHPHCLGDTNLNNLTAFGISNPPAQVGQQ